MTKTDTKTSDAYEFAAKAMCTIGAAVSAYAIAAPEPLLEMNRAFWGVLLFISVFAIPSGLVASRGFRAVWGTIGLLLAITYVVVLRNYQTQGGVPIGDMEGMQVYFTVIVGAVSFFSVAFRIDAWEKNLESGSVPNQEPER